MILTTFIIGVGLSDLYLDPREWLDVKMDMFHYLACNYEEIGLLTSSSCK